MAGVVVANTGVRSMLFKKQNKTKLIIVPVLCIFDTNTFSSCSTISREKFNQNLSATTSSSSSYFMQVWRVIMPPRKEKAIPFVVLLWQCVLWHTLLILEQEFATGKIDQILMEDCSHSVQMYFFPVAKFLLWWIHLLRIQPNRMCSGDSEEEHN